MQSFPRIKNAQDWHNLIGQLISASQGMLDTNLLLQMRLNCYANIEKLRNRPLIVYATRFVDFSAPNAPTSIDLSDVDGFTDLINSVPSGESIDVLLHSPGGRPDATERIVYILRNKFKEVHFLIPHSAYSAATMLALSGNSIVLHPSATLGPIDPQLNGTPARSIKKGFEKVKEIIKNEGPEALPAYIPLIEKYSLDLLELCEDSETLSRSLIFDWIKNFMLHGNERYENQISSAVEFFSNYEKHLLHSRPLILNKVSEFQLNISQSEGELSEYLWEAYLLIGGFFSITAFVKLYENRYNVSWGRQFQQTIQQPAQLPQG